MIYPLISIFSNTIKNCLEILVINSCRILYFIVFILIILFVYLYTKIERDSWETEPDRDREREGIKERE
jgi:uncharacterized membrane protein